MAEQRIQKVLSDQGICSRRAAERMIAEGRVKVNGRPVSLGDKMDPDFDKVPIDGKNQRIVRKPEHTACRARRERGERGDGERRERRGERRERSDRPRREHKED